MTLIFLDTETTGLELHHDIWDIAWAVEDCPIRSALLPHSLVNADPDALELNGYWKRRGYYAYGDGDARADGMLRTLFEGATLVGANPAFDAIRLQLRWRAHPWHYRLLDISSMAYQAFGPREDGKPMGLADVRARLIEEFDGDILIPEPDHTAAGDVATLRACFKALKMVGRV